MTISTCIFDAYGTLFDVSAAARELAAKETFPELRENWEELAQLWRQKQLGYSWLRTIANAPCDFWQVTEDSLDWSLEAVGLSGNAQLRQQLLDLYFTLSAYGEVPEVLTALKTDGVTTGILSNGSPPMLQAAVDSAGIAPLLDGVLSVEGLATFKPAAAVYDLVSARFECSNENVLFVSSNGWDVACATGYGFETVWVNRANEPIDRLPWRPNHIVADLHAVPSIIRGATNK